MRQFSFSIDIAAPPPRVWQIITDVDRWHEWTRSITAVKRLGHGTFAVGMRALVRQPKFPPALWKVTEIDPGRSFTWVSVAPGLRVVAQHSVQPFAYGSRATLSLDFQGPLGGLFGRLTESINQRYIELEGRGLKGRSEARRATDA